MVTINKNIFEKLSILILIFFLPLFPLKSNETSSNHFEEVYDRILNENCLGNQEGENDLQLIDEIMSYLKNKENKSYCEMHYEMQWLMMHPSYAWPDEAYSLALRLHEMEPKKSSLVSILVGDYYFNRHNLKEAENFYLDALNIESYLYWDAYRGLALLNREYLFLQDDKQDEYDKNIYKYLDLCFQAYEGDLFLEKSPLEKVKERYKFGLGVFIEVVPEGIKLIDILNFDNGLEIGDVITHIDSKSVLEMSTDEAIDMLAGEKGKTVNLTVIKNSNNLVKTIYAKLNWAKYSKYDGYLNIGLDRCLAILAVHLYTKPDASKEDKEIAIQMHLILVQNENLHAEPLFVADSYCEGKDGLNYDPILGKYYLEKAALDEDASALEMKAWYLRNGGCGYKKNDFEAFEIIEFLYNEGLYDQSIILEYIEYLFYGIGTVKDPHKAIDIIKPFAEEGNFPFLVLYADLLDDDSTEFYNLKKAIILLEEAITRDDALLYEDSRYNLSYAKYYLAALYDEEFHIENNIDYTYDPIDESLINPKLRFSSYKIKNNTILNLFTDACMSQIGDACERAALMMAYGRKGIEKNLNGSAFLFSQIFLNNEYHNPSFYLNLSRDFPEFSNLVRRLVQEKGLSNQKNNRWAILIGSSDYSNNIPDIPQAINDADLFQKTINDEGFNTQTIYDPTKSFFDYELDKVFRDINNIGNPILSAEKKENSDIILYYSGHAFSYQGKNYLLPIDSPSVFNSFSELKAYVVSLDKLIKKLSEYFSGTKIIIIDACRTTSSISEQAENNNLSFISKNGLLNFIGGDIDGLAPIDTGVDSYVLFASEAGKPALARLNDNNSILTSSLVNAISDFPFDDLETQVARSRDEVNKLSNGNQTPVGYSTLSRKYFLRDIQQRNVINN